MPRDLKYEISVLNDLKRAPRADRRFILETLDRFAQGYTAAFTAELVRTGKLFRMSSGWKGFWQLRLRSYRIVYEEYQKTLLVLLVRDGNGVDATG